LYSRQKIQQHVAHFISAAKEVFTSLGLFVFSIEYTFGWPPISGLKSSVKSGVSRKKGN
jgi:hypothetical protein